MTESAEKLLALPDGRTLAYSEAGNASSSTVVIYLHGAFTVGDAKRPSPIILEKGVHFVAPTLPGWGNSSPLPRGMAYATNLATVITALIDHLHPGATDLKLYIAGGSFGTAPAQMLYGASYDIFPPGRNIAALLLVGAITPFHSDKNYAKSMTWPNYFMAGPPGRILPNVMPHIVKLILASKVRTPEGAEAFIRDTVFNKMGESERHAFNEWRVSRGKSEGEVERDMGQNIVRSVAKTWDGFLCMADVLHSGWGGFTPSGLDDEHSRAPVLVVSSKGDDIAPEAWSTYLVENYKNARLKSIEGGHIAAMFHWDEIWSEFMVLERA
jgi:pimeloyl-ACP methyl ester carboxylesterase